MPTFTNTHRNLNGKALFQSVKNLSAIHYT